MNKKPAMIQRNHTLRSINKKILDIPLTPFMRTPMGWFVSFFISFAILQLLLVTVVWLFAKGVGIWGINIPVGWGFAIINFVWWVGIAHAGTFISAILFLLKQDWRTSINRYAEAMTLFAVVCAGLFPLLHMGRPWLFYWMFPYPSTMGVWPQFRSPLVWDVFAVSTYATVSLLFWYMGLIPDLASIRDRAKNKVVAMLYGIFALGWRGSARHWNRYQIAYLLLAGLATPLVVSVHTVVSFDFAMSLIPGWHTTVFPPYFVAGAIYSGFAMVLSLLIPIRKLYGLQDFITDYHIDNMAKIMLATGLVVGYGYLIEAFAGWYSANEAEQYMTWNRMVGPYAFIYWLLILCNGLTPQALWFKQVRSNHLVLFAITIVVNIGMWLERFVIVITSLHRDFLPSSWDLFIPTGWDWATYLGTIGLFLTLVFLFMRVLPMIAGFEMKEVLYHMKHQKAKESSHE
jgi:Ni/Fe-hydrogenase subunit HybB-like protein